MKCILTVTMFFVVVLTDSCLYGGKNEPSSKTRPTIHEMAIFNLLEIKNTWKKYQKIKPKTNPYICSLCYQVYKNRTNGYEHENYWHCELKPYVCSHCGEGFSFGSTGRMHLKSCSGKKKVKKLNEHGQSHSSHK